MSAGSARAQQPAASPSPPAAAKPSDSGPSLSGYAQVDYRRGDHQSLATAPEHEFNVRRARVGVAGKIGARVAYAVTIQGDGLNVNTASFRDFYADVTISSRLKLRAGQNKYDFDMEGRESGNLMPLPDRVRVTNTVAGSLTGAGTASNTASDFRDRGISLFGSAKTGSVTWGYAAGAYQGTGRASDNNSEFGFVVRGQVDPTPGLKLSAGYLSSDNTAEGARDEDSYSAWTAGAAYERKRVFLRGEYYHARREKAAARQDVDGFYLVGSYSPHDRVDVLARYQVLEDGRFPAGNDRLDSVDFAVKYYFERREGRSGTLLSLGYSIRNADAGFASGVTLNDGRGAALTRGADVGNVLQLRLQVRF
jgi:hypothetical protein